jgi:hypothetical protein
VHEEGVRRSSHECCPKSYFAHGAVTAARPVMVT